MRVKRKPLDFETKYLALKKSGGRCPYCDDFLEVENEIGAKFAVDHIIPLWRGGADHIDNMIACCRSCNAKKHTKTGLEYFCEIEGIQVSWFAKFNPELDGFMADIDLEDRPEWASPAWAMVCEDFDCGEGEDYVDDDDPFFDDFDLGDFPPAEPEEEEQEPDQEEDDQKRLADWMARHEEAHQ